MLSRTWLVALITVFLLNSMGAAETGILQLEVRDAVTHYAVQSRISLEGPKQLFAQTDPNGRVHLTLAPGEYRIEVSATGYKALRTHSKVALGRNLPLTIMLDRESPPDEERPDIIAQNVRPGFTLLHGFVVDSDSGKPLSGATVRLVTAGVETQTDSRGHYFLSAPTTEPVIQGTMGTDTLVFEKSGYKSIIFNNFGITGEEMGGSAVDLERGQGVIKRDAKHKLMQEPGAAAVEPQSSPLQTPAISDDLYRWLGVSGEALGPSGTLNAGSAQAITVPTSIRVGTGGSSSRSYQPCASKTTCTNVLIFSLESYVTQGIPGEWMTSWASDAQKAGSVAYRSYGAYYIAHPADPNGNYDICNTTDCQLYDPWDFPANNTSKAAVNSTAGIVLSRDNVTIFQAEYAANTNAMNGCPEGTTGDGTPSWPCMADPITFMTNGSGHGRGMSQWGSQWWATGFNSQNGRGTTPRDWQCILDHYYNDNGNNTGAGTGLRTAFIEGPGGNGRIVANPVIKTKLGTYALATTKADGSDLFVFTKHLGGPSSYSPGGRMLAYNHGCPDGLSGAAWLINSDETGVEIQMTPCSGNWQRSEGELMWSPNGDRFAYYSNLYTTSQNGDWYTMNRDGSDRRRLTTNELEISNITWSPDQSRLIFDMVPPPYAAWYSQLYMINADGTGQTPLTSQSMFEGFSCMPNWAPDGKRIVFVSTSQDSPTTCLGYGGSIWVMNLENGSTQRITFDDNQAFPKWSPDGSKILFEEGVNVLQNGPLSLVVANKDGSNQQQIFSNIVYGPADWRRCERFTLDQIQ